MPTTSTTVSRLLVDHPDLGHDSGSGLHGKVRTAWTKWGDQLNSRFFIVDALANSASADFEHNFKDSFANIRVLLYNRNTGTGELTRIVKGGSPDLDNFTIIATPGNETTQIRVSNGTGGAEDIAVVFTQGFFAEKMDDLSDVDIITVAPTVGQTIAWNGTNFVPKSLSLGGSALKWNAPDGSSPLAGEENSELIYLFEPSSVNKLVVFAKIPAGHDETDPVNMKIGLYSPSTSDTILLSATAYLIRTGIDAVSSTANSHASTNVALTNTAPADRFREATIDLTDGSGNINALPANGGDLIRIELVRGTDTDTLDCRFVPSATEIGF